MVPSGTPVTSPASAGVRPQTSHRSAASRNCSGSASSARVSSACCSLRANGTADRHCDRGCSSAMPPPAGARPSRSSSAGTGRASTRSRCASAATPTTPRTRCRRRSSRRTARCRASTAGRASRPGSTGSRPTSATTSSPGGARRRMPASLPEAADPHDPFARSGQSALLTQALDALPEQFREAALLCDVCGLTPAEAGEVAGVPEGTMKSRSFRARGAARDRTSRGRRGTGDGKRGLTAVDDASSRPERRGARRGRARARRARRAAAAAGRGDAARCPPGSRAGLVAARSAQGRGAAVCAWAPRSRRPRRSRPRSCSRSARAAGQPRPGRRARSATRRRPPPRIRPLQRPPRSTAMKVAAAPSTAAAKNARRLAEQAVIVPGRGVRVPEVGTPEPCDHAPARRALQQPLLQQIRLVDVLDRAPVLADRVGQRREADRARPRTSRRSCAAARGRGDRAPRRRRPSRSSAATAVALSIAPSPRT